MAHREKAFEILAELKVSHPDRRPRGLRRHHDATILTTLLGVVVACMSVWTWQDSLTRIAAFLGLLMTSFCLGFVVDRGRRNYLHFGHFQFSMKEWLGLTAMVALLVSFWSWLLNA